MKIMIAELRKDKGISQQELANVLGVAYQTVSKWENNVTYPDITLLPRISQYFDVTVDELLGLKPLPSQAYIPSKAGTKAYWNERLEYLKRTRESLWNKDYLQFLIEKVWKIHSSISVLDCGCGYGFLCNMLMPLLPRGSTYTGIDFSEDLIKDAKATYEADDYEVQFICNDVMIYNTAVKFDLVISQAVLRHIDNPCEFLEKMVSFTKEGGLIICAEVDRELEEVGLYIHGMNYGYLCEQPGFRKMWKTQWKRQGRDYSIGIKLPQMMKKLGLRDVDIRMNDKVTFISPDMQDYIQKSSDFIESHDFSSQKASSQQASIIEQFMNHGMDRKEAEHYL